MTSSFEDLFHFAHAVTKTLRHSHPEWIADIVLLAFPKNAGNWGQDNELQPSGLPCIRHAPEACIKDMTAMVQPDGDDSKKHPDVVGTSNVAAGSTEAASSTSHDKKIPANKKRGEKLGVRWMAPQRGSDTFEGTDPTASEDATPEPPMGEQIADADGVPEAPDRCEGGVS